MDCPNCKLINPPGTQRCDCGFEFAAQTERPLEAPAKRRLTKTIAWAVAIFALDGLILGQGILSGVVLVYAVLFLVPLGVLVRKDKSLGRLRLKKAGIFAMTALAVFGVVFLNNRLAESSASDVIAAVVQYRGKYGRYPDQLQELVPEFMVAVPLAKLTLSNNGFGYNSGTNPMLWYVELPPQRRIYYFETGRWNTLD
jgi:hypothetical protein